jgi:hypothetical protein
MNARLDKPTDHHAKELPRASARTAVLILPSSPAASQAVPADERQLVWPVALTH